MNRAQTTPTSETGPAERGLVDAIFTALTAASSFVPMGSTSPPAPFDPEPHPVVPRFRGWIQR